jgi:hypothetical protein
MPVQTEKQEGGVSDIVSGEVIEANFDAHAAKVGTEKIRMRLERIGKDASEVLDLIDRAIEERWYLPLGYETHAQYVDAEFGDAMRGLPRGVRPEFSQRLVAHGLSTRTVAGVLGVSDFTVRQDTSGARNHAPESVTGRDGKTYQRKQPGPKKRRPLPDQMLTAGQDIHKLTNKVRAIATDDRFGANQKQAYEYLSGYLREAIETYQAILDSITNEESTK